MNKVKTTDRPRQLRKRSILALLTATVMIVVILGVQYLLSVQNDETECRRLVHRDLQIASLKINDYLKETEWSVDDIQDEVRLLLPYPDSLYALTRRSVMGNALVKSISIGFEPYYYADRGRWFEPATYRSGDSLVSQQAGSRQHDYLTMEWYAMGLKQDISHGYWSKPYHDNTQDNLLLMSYSLPVLNDAGVKVGVISLDVSLEWVKQILQEVKPYPGSVCQLLSSQGEPLVWSDDIQPNDDDYFISSQPLGRHQLLVLIACPKTVVYGRTILLNWATLILLVGGILLLAFIVQRSIRSINKLDEADRQQQMMDSEMQIAHDIQMDILRRDFPEELCATLLPMKEVGGDLYDFYQKDGTLYFIIGDVSGKGIPAAMMMSATVNLFRMAARHFTTPADIMGEINHVLAGHNPSMMFVTAFVGKIDMGHGLLTYCNAGHNAPFLNTQMLESDHDIPLGYQADYDYRQYGALFPEGSRLVLYTDGISEARNAEHQMMGTERLMSIAAQYYMGDISAMVDHITDETAQFIGDADLTDDVTLMCIANDTPQQSPALIITNEMEELQRVKSLLREYCDCLGCDRRVARKILLAAEEAVANIIDYAYPRGTLGRIEIDIQGTPSLGSERQGDLTISISDFGEPFDPTARQEVDVERNIEERQVGGLGIYLYQKLMDFVGYQRTIDGRNVLTMSKTI